MKLESLPIWPRILAAKPAGCKAGKPRNILSTVLAAGGLRQKGPARNEIADWTLPYYSRPRPRYCSGLLLLDYRSRAARAGAKIQSRYGPYLQPSPGLTQVDRAARREKDDPKFARAQARKRAALLLRRQFATHIAERYHATVRRLYTSKYASIVWSDFARSNVEWDRYAKSYKYPCKYLDAGVMSDATEIRIHPTSGTTIRLPMPGRALCKAWAKSEPHPIGLFAVPVKSQTGVFACMTAQPGGAKWTVGGFCVRGRLVPECVAHGTTTLADITAQQNTETRQVMIERYGLERYLAESSAVEIDHSDVGTLYEISGMKVVKVVNSTPEPDGSYKDYFLRVPPTMTSAQEAVAWTFGLNATEYQPAVQS